jgi:FkbM family methyltransferase
MAVDEYCKGMIPSLLEKLDSYDPLQKSECILFQKAKTHFGIPIKGVLHIGSSIGEEIRFYEAEKVEKITYVDANPIVVEALRQRLFKELPSIEITTHCFAAVSEEKELELNITSNIKSSSLLELSKHKTDYPSITHVGKLKVQGKRIDDVLSTEEMKDINCMVLDVQCGEYDALIGCGDLLDQIDVIISEVTFYELYKGCCLIEHLDTMLLSKGFRRLDTLSNGRGWGDALYIRKDIF